MALDPGSDGQYELKAVPRRHVLKWWPVVMIPTFIAAGWVIVKDSVLDGETLSPTGLAVTAAVLAAIATTWYVVRWSNFERSMADRHGTTLRVDRDGIYLGTKQLHVPWAHVSGIALLSSQRHTDAEIRVARQAPTAPSCRSRSCRSYCQSPQSCARMGGC